MVFGWQKGKIERRLSMNMKNQERSTAQNQRITISKKDWSQLVKNALQLTSLADAEKYAPELCR